MDLLKIDPLLCIRKHVHHYQGKWLTSPESQVLYPKMATGWPDEGQRDARCYTEKEIVEGTLSFWGSMMTIINYNPYAPCMEYLPTFALKITQMLVNIPYMEHMGNDYNQLDMIFGYVCEWGYTPKWQLSSGNIVMSHEIWGYSIVKPTCIYLPGSFLVTMLVILC